MDKLLIFSGLLNKIGASCFFCSQKGQFEMGCTLFGMQKKSKSPYTQNSLSRNTEYWKKKQTESMDLQISDANPEKNVTKSVITMSSG